MYIAVIEAGSYLDFANPVPFRDADGPIERGLLNEHGKISGRAQSAVRPISPADFNRITELGLAEDTALLPRVEAPSVFPGMQEEQLVFQHEQERNRVAYLTSRIVRDRIFRRIVLRAYDARCAITSLKLINGSGRAEVEAAHIRPVEANGPDIVSNGLALSGTAHWMFDRGLIGITDDHEILISRQVNDTAGVRAMINKTGRILDTCPRRRSAPPAFLAVASRELLQGVNGALSRIGHDDSNFFWRAIIRFLCGPGPASATAPNGTRSSANTSEPCRSAAMRSNRTRRLIRRRGQVSTAP